MVGSAVQQCPRTSWRRQSIVLGIVVAITLGSSGAVAQTGVAIDPTTNDFELADGETWSEDITVTVPADTASPLVDIYLLADTTGSMDGPISAVRAGAEVIVDDLVAALPDSDIRFGVGDFKDFPGDRYAFRQGAGLTSDLAAVKGAIDAWFAEGGNDGPEGQFYAFDQIASNRAPSNDGSAAGSIGWRPGSARILVVFADAPAHDPVCSEITALVNGHAVDYDITEATVINKLVSAGITFVGVSTLTGYSNGMDADPEGAGDYTASCGAETLGTAGQASRIAEATGGVHQLGIDNAEIVQVIAAEVLNVARSIANLSLVPAGETAEFVTAVDPADGHGPFDTEEERSFGFTVDWLGTVAATAEDQVFTGTLDVVADGVVVAQKPVTIRVPGTDAPPPGGSGGPAPGGPGGGSISGPGTSVLPEAGVAVPVRARPSFTG